MPAKRTYVWHSVVAALAVIQIAFAYSIRNLDPKRDYLDPVPSSQEQAALALGDTQFLFRLYALEIQNAGDTGGRIVPVKNYNFGKVVGWLDVLDHLDPRSDFAIGMANGFFGLSQDVKNVDPVVRFMMRSVAIDPPRKWRWLYGAIYLARHRLRDDNLALEAARQLASYNFDGIDPWATMMPAFILEDQGNYAGAAAVVRDTVQRFGPRLSKDDASWTASYLDFLSKVEAGLVKPRRRAW
jgi:hypothetical protein